MNTSRSAILVVALMLGGCATVTPCAPGNGPTLGGWMVDEESEFGVHQLCDGSDHHFVLKRLVERDAEGRAIRWDELADLPVRVHRGEQLMFGFECGSEPARRGDVIAVVKSGTDDPVRAWVIDTVAQQFRVIPPESVTCESSE